MSSPPICVSGVEQLLVLSTFVLKLNVSKLWNITKYYGHSSDSFIEVRGDTLKARPMHFFKVFRNSVFRTFLLGFMSTI